MIKNGNKLNDAVINSILSDLSGHIGEYKDSFCTSTSDSGILPELYVERLIKTERGKRNMERLYDELDMDGDGYHQVQQFIVDSAWDASCLILKIAQNNSKLYANQEGYDVKDVGYIIDESAHLKKGNDSAGVSRQYAGIIGKVDNCQVGVYSSLVWQSHTCLINCRLFVPECWSEDTARCIKAGIPEDKRRHKTKLELALEMVEADIEAGIRFGWVGGNGLYGHGCQLNYAIEDMGLLFLFDIHNDQAVYEQESDIFVPKKKPGKGRAPKIPRTQARAVTVKSYKEKLDEDQWEIIEVRDTTKCRLTLSIHVMQVWVWDNKEKHARKRILVISRNNADNKIKYGLSNADITTTSVKQFAFTQA